MSLSSFPDVNVWLALLREDHIHRDAAIRWMMADQSHLIGFTRFTQVSVLRLLTTSAAMNGRPLSMKSAWHAYDLLFWDHRVAFVEEPPAMEGIFRVGTFTNHTAPKVWADAYLVAFAKQAGGQIVTFDKGLAARATDSILLA